MSEFVQTMKDWRRMCQHMAKMFGDNSCDRCPLVGCAAIYEDNGEMDYADVKNKVDAWAAEHPEPQYPTWAEWLSKQGFVELKDGQFVKQTENEYVYECKTVAVLTEKAAVPIPADIAHKLEIELKGAR